MQNNKEKSLKQFNIDLFSLYEQKVPLSSLIKDSTSGKLKLDYYRESSVINEDDFSWKERMNSVINRIKTIISNPRLHIKTEKEVRRAAVASKVDHVCLQLTFRDLKLWKKRTLAFEPERVYCNVFEDDIAIYENRFITYLLDKMFEYVTREISQLYAKVEKLDRLVVNNNITLGDADFIRKCTPFYRITETPTESGANVELVDAKDRIPLLTSSDDKMVKILEYLLKMKQKLIQLFESEFYKECKKAGRLTQFYPTNMLLQDPDYNYCWMFYNDFIMQEEQQKTYYITKKYYENYVLTTIVKTLTNMGFKPKRDNFVINSENGRMIFENVTFTREPISMTINSTKENSIEIFVELKYYLNKFHKDIDLHNRRTSKILLELHPNVKKLFPTPKDMNIYFKGVIASRAKNYNNVYIVSPIKDLNNPDVVMCSPDDLMLDSNIENMLKSFTVLVEGSSFIYSRKCPMCGSTMITYEEGNCVCDDCHSMYSILRSGKEEARNEMIWLKRMKKDIE